jgi:hypothetical protein
VLMPIHKDDSNTLGLKRVLGLKSYETAWNWLHKLCQIIVRPGRDLLTGRIEVDETISAPRKRDSIVRHEAQDNPGSIDSLEIQRTWFDASRKQWSYPSLPPSIRQSPALVSWLIIREAAN